MLSILDHDRVTRLPFSMGSVVTILDGTECLQCVGGGGSEGQCHGGRGQAVRVGQG